MKTRAKKSALKDSSCGWVINAEYITSVDQDRQEYALHLFATWLVRAILARIGPEENTSPLATHPEQLALTSEPVNCTLGTSSSCNSGGSNK